MTDYYYQATRRGDPPEEEGEAPFADAARRRNPYPLEDEAYWAEGDRPLPGDEEPLWYEDRIRRAEAAAEPPANVRRGAGRDSPRHWTDPEVPLPPDRESPSYWATPMEAEGEAEPWPAGAGYAPREEAAEWADDPLSEEGLASSARTYVPGAAAAAAIAAAESGERTIRFDPTKERGPAYYDHAARHTRRVRILRIALPAVAVLAVIGFFAVMSFDADDGGLPALNLSGINIESRQITMDKPHISGFDGTKRAYEVRAAKATQQLGNAKVVTLETITAKFALGDDVRATLEAVSGIYDGNTQKLKLQGGIDLATNNGYTAELDEADIDVEAGDVASDTGVVIRGKEGSITANSIEVLDRGKHIFFRGDVKVVYHPPETPEQEEPGGTAAAPPAAAPAIIEAAPDGST